MAYKRRLVQSAWLLLLATLWCTTAAAQSVIIDTTVPTAGRYRSADTARSVYYRFNGTYLKTWPYDLARVASGPARWQGKDWLKFGAITASAGAMMVTVDRPFRRWVQNNRGSVSDKVSEVAYPLGNRFPPFFLAGLYVTSLVTKNRRMEHASLSVAKSLAISTLFYTSSKTLIRRQRPTRTDDPTLFTAPFTKNDYTSFPSGHTNTAFAVATAFTLEYPDKKWMPWVAYSMATLTGLSRINDDRHWLSDVVIGAAIGHFVTRGVYRLEQKRRDAKRINLKGI